MDDVDVTIATCRELPEPDPDEQPLREALQEAGLSVRVSVWNDEDVDWSKGRLTLIWSTWDYYRDRAGFIEWAEKIDEVSMLHNPVEVVRWNSHKRYLLTLPLKGVPIVPTAMVETDSEVELAEICSHENWDKVVVKPAVSVGSYETHAMDAEELDEAVFDRVAADADILVQPYIDSVDDYGERSLIFVDDEFTHCVRKNPRFAGDAEKVTGPVEPTDRELSIADRAMDAVGAPLLYGRVDLVRNRRDEPVVAELELLEPSLFFRFCDRAVERLVAGIESRLSSLE